MPMGGRTYTPSCSFRYELYIFYNASRIQELELLPPLPPPPQPPRQLIPTTPTGQNENNTTGTRRRTRTIIIIVVSVVASLVLVTFVGFLLRNKISRKPREDFQLNADDISIVDSLQYEFGRIKVATNDFSEANKLGRGGFGTVYKGKLLNGQEIAVKRLAMNSGQGNQEFKNEVIILARLQHRHLVRLFGFSMKGTEKLLVYEFIQNASLDHFIFDATKRSNLTWDRRHKIISGIARGLLYLHEDSRLRIIHRDLKASNVLLDGEMNPKIADFGMARLFVPDESHCSTKRIVGTYGYMSPEYAMLGQFSVKSDVFSFGVLVLEIISGQKNYCFREGENNEHLISRAWKYWRGRSAVNLIDPVLRGSLGSPRDILKCIHIGLLCVQENVDDRPIMAAVVEMLNSSSIDLPIPSVPAYYMIGSYTSEGESSDRSRNRELNTSSGDASQKEVSITEFYPR